MTPLEEAHAQVAALILLLSENGVDIDVTLARLREAKGAAAFDNAGRPDASALSKTRRDSEGAHGPDSAAPPSRGRP